jgi:hypothetical protein
MFFVGGRTRRRSFAKIGWQFYFFFIQFALYLRVGSALVLGLGKASLKSIEPLGQLCDLITDVRDKSFPGLLSIRTRYMGGGV